MGQARDYEALIRELLAGVAGGWSYGSVIVLLMTKSVDETDLALWLRDFAEGFSLERDRELIEQLKLLGEKYTPGKLASEAFSIAAKFDRSDEQGSELLNHEVWFDRGNELCELGRYEDAITSYDRAINIKPDYHEAFFNRGVALGNLGQYEETIISFEQAIEIKPDKHDALYNRGFFLGRLGRYEEAISTYDRAIEIKHNYDLSWSNRGVALGRLGRYEEAIISFDQAIKIKPDDHETWYNRGIALVNLERYEDAISSYERAIEFKPDEHQSWSIWYIRGNNLLKSGRYKEAIVSFNRAIEIKPNSPETFYARGFALSNLERYKEAITSYDQAIETWHLHKKEIVNSGDRIIETNPEFRYWYGRGITLGFSGRYGEAIESYDRATHLKPDDFQVWMNRGILFCDFLKYYKEALQSFNRAIEIKPDLHEAWSNQGIALVNSGQYEEAIRNYDRAFQHIYRDTHPEGWGYLQHKIGRTHYQEGTSQLFNHQRNPQSYYDLALTHYQNALQTLTSEEFPKLRLDTLIDTAKVYLAQHNTPAARQYKTEAFHILRDLLNTQSPEGKKRLQIEYQSLQQLDVDLFIANGDNINALIAAELEKNNRLTWLLTALSEKTISPSYVQMRQLLGMKSASTTLNIRGLDRAITLPLAKNSPIGIIYWHLSSDRLTTFTLTANDSQPLVWESDRRQQAQQLIKWIKEWDTQYRDYGSKKSVATQPSPNGEVIKNEKEHHPWRKNLPDYLAQLHQILEIDKICAQLPTTLTHLILIPHGDLHRFPLHTLFLTSANLTNLQSCTYLPSIQIGLNLQQRSTPTRSYAPLLSVEDPETHQAEMPFAQIESTIVRHLLQTHTHINSKSANLDTVEKELSKPHASFHFTGHAAYNSRSPETSALALTDEPLTAKRISQLNLSSYNLITLAACETAITGRENINTEYIGLSSAFLQAGAANVLSTLWQVDEIANAWFTIYFYQQLLSGKSPAVALTITQRWLQTVTWQNLADWLAQFSSLKIVKLYVEKEILEKEGKLGLDRTTKYSHPYYWAAFTLTGQG